MDVRALVPGKTDKTDLAGFPGFQDDIYRSFGKNAVWIGIANHFMELKQVNSICLQPAQRFIELGCSSSLVPAVDLGHQKGFLAITVAQRLAHSNLALSAVIVPAVIEEIYSLIDSRPNNANALLRVALFAQVIATQPNHRNFFPGPAQNSVWNSARAIWLCSRA